MIKSHVEILSKTTRSKEKNFLKAKEPVEMDLVERVFINFKRVTLTCPEKGNNL